MSLDRSVLDKRRRETEAVLKQVMDARLIPALVDFGKALGALETLEYLGGLLDDQEQHLEFKAQAGNSEEKKC